MFPMRRAEVAERGPGEPKRYYLGNVCIRVLIRNSLT